MNPWALEAMLARVDAIERGVARCATADASRAEVEARDLQEEIDELRSLLKAKWRDAIREEVELAAQARRP